MSEILPFVLGDQLGPLALYNQYLAHPKKNLKKI